MSVISIRFDSIRFVSSRLSLSGRERETEGRNRVTAREGLVSRLAWFGCYREGRVYYKFFLLADMRLGFAVVVGCAVR